MEICVILVEAHKDEMRSSGVDLPHLGVLQLGYAIYMVPTCIILVALIVLALEQQIFLGFIDKDSLLKVFRDFDLET